MMSLSDTRSAIWTVKAVTVKAVSGIQAILQPGPFFTECCTAPACCIIIASRLTVPCAEAQFALTEL